MTSASDTLQDLGAGSDTTPLRAKWGRIVALGVVRVIAVFIGLGGILIPTAVKVLVAGVMMIVAEIADVFDAFRIKSRGKLPDHDWPSPAPQRRADHGGAARIGLGLDLHRRRPTRAPCDRY